MDCDSHFHFFILICTTAQGRLKFLYFVSQYNEHHDTNHIRPQANRKRIRKQQDRQTEISIFFVEIYGHLIPMTAAQFCSGNSCHTYSNFQTWIGVWDALCIFFQYLINSCLHFRCLMLRREQQVKLGNRIKLKSITCQGLTSDLHLRRPVEIGRGDDTNSVSKEIAIRSVPCFPAWGTQAHMPKRRTKKYLLTF